MKAIKEAVYQHCERFLLEKAKAYALQDQSLLAALDSEGKSSAGDKHETGRAMVQLEREKLGHQRQLNEALFETLKALKNKKITTLIAPGTLVSSSLATYYIAVPADVFEYNGQSIYCISPQSPIGQLLLGHKTGAKLFFREKDFEVLEVG